MRKNSRKSKKPSIRQDPNAPYELYRTLPNPIYAANKPAARLTSTQSKQKRTLKEKIKKAAVISAVGLGVLLVGSGGWLSWKFLRDFGWANLESLFDTTRLKGENEGRVNILLAGYSVDDPGHDGAALTDSVMVVSIDTKNDKAYMLSISRDLYVSIPGFGYSKINEAYEDGSSENFDVSGYPKGGMGLLEQVVSKDFNMPIDYYALIDYTAFRDAVNAVGGVKIDIQSSDPRGLYDPNTNLNLPNGWVTLNGQEALNLARARGDGPGAYGFPLADFDRTMHQRQMLEALAAKATTVGVLANSVKIGDLFDAFGNNVKTDLMLNDVRRLYTVTKKIPQSKIQSAALNTATYNGKKNVDLLQSYYTDSGEDALIPAAGINDYTQIDAYISQLDAQN